MSGNSRIQGDPYFDRIIALADASVQRFQPEKLKWMWGEALYTYALSLLDDALGENRYLDFNRAYLDAHIQKGYRVDQSDTMAPGLTAFALLQKTGDERYAVIVDRVLHYLKHSRSKRSGRMNRTALKKSWTN